MKAKEAARRCRRSSGASARVNTNMVTTIKITGDGVFIQSNSYLANGGGGGIGAHLHSRQQSASSEPGGNSSGSNSSSLSRGGEFGGPGSDHGSSSSGGHEDHQMSRSFTNIVKDRVDRDRNNNNSLDPRVAFSDSNNNFPKISRRRYQSEEVLPRLQKFSGSSDGSDTVDAAGSTYYNSSAESDDQFTISFLNTRGHNGKSLLNQKFIVYNSKKPRQSSILTQNGYHHPGQYRQYLNGRLKPAYSTSVLTSPSLIAASIAESSPDRPSTGTPPPRLTVAKSTSYLQRTISPAPSPSLSSLSPSSGFASTSPTPPSSGSLPTAAAASPPSVTDLSSGQ
ncbi:uncharacterized protein LOC134204017 [Armigeres subalbatus]|uniref:uncharacterized protein LOC134204017 n=1 Tax=Armigeres subalbatus TaxID=124917 RepID=UPI002ED0A5AF